jgi:hypothetical protein
MLKKLLPVILAVVGLGTGVGAGIMLKPAPEAADAEHAAKAGDHAKDDGHGADDGHAKEGDDHAKAGDGHGASSGGHGDEGGTKIVRLENQFVVPVIDDAEVSALVVLSLNLEVDAAAQETVYAYEPKLRDAFLGVLFEHANAGGFHGAFTSSGTMNLLRTALRESAQKTLGDAVHEVLITNIVRQKV